MAQREFRITWAGRHKVADWEPLYEDYRGRIRRHVPLREIEVRAKAGSDVERLQREAQALDRAVEGRIVALDLRGRALSSRQWAHRLQRWLEDPNGVSFVLGSDLGLSREFLQRSDEVISFGPVTLAHRLARLVLYEQIYRGIAQLRGIKYHRDEVG